MQDGGYDWRITNGSAKTEQWNGSSWAEQNNLNTQKARTSGTQTAAISGTT